MQNKSDIDPDIEKVAAALQLSIGLFLRRVRQLKADDGGLTLPENSALARLDRGGPSTGSQLARAEQISPQAMGATLAALEARGLVRRQADPDDGRRAVFSVTATGLDLLHSRRSARTAQLARALAADFTPTEVERLTAAAPLIERLAQSI